MLLKRGETHRETPEDTQASEVQQMKYFVGTALGKKDFNGVEKHSWDCTGRCNIVGFFSFMLGMICFHCL